MTNILLGIFYKLRDGLPPLDRPLNVGSSCQDGAVVKHSRVIDVPQEEYESGLGPVETLGDDDGR